MRIPLLLLLSAAVCSGEVFFKETFDPTWESRWQNSKKKDGLGKFELSAGEWYGDAEINKGIKTSEDAKFYAISTKIPKPFTNKDQPLVVSFTVKHQQGIDCGGGYIKVLPAVEPADFHGESPYFIMFGPDICGHTKKIHLIFGYKGKNLLWKKEPRCEDDKLTHLYTLIVNPDGTYEVQVDGEKKESGRLEDDWDFLLPKEIDDPTDKKPADWVEEPEMDDPEDKKPEDWDSEPKEIDDPDAEKPEDWDEDEDGTWEPPRIANPKYKGAWKPKRIPNPAYKGVWKAKQIANPDYVEDKELYATREPLGSVGIDIWQVKSGTIFDNIIITNNIDEVLKFNSETFEVTRKTEKEMFEKLEKERKELEDSQKKEEKEEETDDEE